MHERPIGDLVDALRALGCGVECLGSEGYPPLRVSAGARPLSLRRAAQGARRRLQPVPDRAAAGAAAARRAGRRGDRGRRRADLQALRRDHAEPARALRHRRRARGLAALSPRRRPAAALARAASRSRATRRRRRTSSPPAAIGAVDAPLRIEGVDSGLDPGRHRLRRRGAGDGRAHRDRAAAGSKCGAAAGRWRAIDLDCNHTPRRGDDARRAGPLRRRPVDPAQHRQLAGQGDRSPRGDGERAAQGRRRRRAKARTSSRITPPTAWRAASDRHLRRPPDGDVRVAGRLQPARRRHRRCRCASSTRAASARPCPTTSRPCSAVAQARREAIPVLTIDGPTASGKGTLASEVAAALGYHLLDSGAVYRATALAALDAGIAADDEAALADAGRGARPALRRRPLPPRRPRRHRRPAPRGSRRAGLADLGLAGGPRGALLELQLAFRRLPGLVADGRDMGTRRLPRRRAQGVPHRQRRPNVRSGATSS